MGSADEKLDLANLDRTRTGDRRAARRVGGYLADRSDSQHRRIHRAAHDDFERQEVNSTKFAGTITAKGNDPASVSIDVTIDTASIDTRSADRDADLKSANFLDVAKYPTMTFKSKKIEAAGPGKWNVVGDLTLHGVTKEVTLAVEGPTAPIKDPWGNTRAGASATTKISRKDFGLTWNKMIEAGGAVVGDEVSVSIDVEAVKKK